MVSLSPSVARSLPRREPSPSAVGGKKKKNIIRKAGSLEMPLPRLSVVRGRAGPAVDEPSVDEPVVDEQAHGCRPRKRKHANKETPKADKETPKAEKFHRGVRLTEGPDAAHPAPSHKPRPSTSASARSTSASATSLRAATGDDLGDGIDLNLGALRAKAVYA